MSSSRPLSPDPSSPRRIRIVTGVRLHFGLLRTVSPFGGAGVMLESSNNVIEINESDRFDCDSRYRDRIDPIVDRMIQLFGWTQRPRCEIRIPTPFESHVGLGSGTQLSMGIVHGLCEYSGERFDPIEMATSLAGRGKRSAVGVHGYALGGMIIEEGRGDSLNSIVERIELPTQWEVGFFVPPVVENSVSGEYEQTQFNQLPKVTTTQLDCLRSVLMNELAVAAREGDFDRFTDSLTKYNHDSGELFVSVQGGAYNGPIITEFVKHLQSLGAVGVGQSSWGPGVFCWFRSRQETLRFSEECRGRVPDFTIAKPLNQGAQVIVEP